MSNKAHCEWDLINLLTVCLIISRVIRDSVNLCLHCKHMIPYRNQEWWWHMRWVESVMIQRVYITTLIFNLFVWLTVLITLGFWIRLIMVLNFTIWIFMSNTIYECWHFEYNKFLTMIGVWFVLNQIHPARFQLNRWLRMNWFAYIVCTVCRVIWTCCIPSNAYLLSNYKHTDNGCIEYNAIRLYYW